jgi:hypothetical protein
VARGLLWLAVIDLRRSWLRSCLVALGMGLAILALALFARQVDLRQAEVLAGYEEAGAATFIAEVPRVADADIDALAADIRGLRGVQSAEAPYSGIGLGVVADVSFLVFENEQQKEYLGARTTVLGVDQGFEPGRDYYVNFHDVNANAPNVVLGVPLLVAAGAPRVSGPDAVLVASDVTDYVGVRPNVEATIELLYTAVSPPIVRRFEGLRLVGAFDVVGPDQGRFEPFWRLFARGREVLTVRRPEAANAVNTTLPTVLNIGVVRAFLVYVRAELKARGLDPPRPLTRDQLVIRARSIAAVPTVEADARSLLQRKGLTENCDAMQSGSFCLRLPERNNFQTALQEQSKVARGGAFFVALLLALIAVGTAGLQVQNVLVRWREFGVLQAIGFSRGQILGHYGLQVCLLLAGGIALAAIASLMLPSSVSGSLVSVCWAAGVSVIAAGLSAIPVLLWPILRIPAELIREAA